MVIIITKVKPITGLLIFFIPLDQFYVAMKNKLCIGTLSLLIISCLISLPCIAAVENPSVEAQGEIEYLLAFLETSDCEFNRNGTWYGGKEAVAHINRKYQYLLKKGLVSTTESFIERAASKSSMSGRVYQVRCGSSDPVDSKDWFSLELLKKRENKS